MARNHLFILLTSSAVAACYFASVEVAQADGARTTPEPIHYRRYDDPAVDGDVFKVLEAALNSKDSEIEATGCKTQPPRKLSKAKLIDAGDKQCPGPDSPPGTHFVSVIPGKVEKIEGDVITVSYPIAGAGQSRATLELPTAFVATKNIKPGAEVIFVPSGIATRRDGDVAAEFKRFENQLKINPDSWKEKVFSIQIR